VCYNFGMKRIIVTGGAGFLGSNLCARLLSEGHHVTVVDNLHTGRERNLAPLRAKEAYRGRLDFVRHDIEEPLTLPCDQLYHFACPASPPHYQADPIRTFRTAVLGTLNLLELARRNGARMLIASTSEVYGDPLEHPQRESYWGHVNPIGIRACYDEGKRGAETLAMDYHRGRGLDVRIIRIFNTYGPHMRPDDGRVVSNLICQAIAGQDLTLFGDGNQTRSFCYVDDLVEGIVRMMENTDGFIGPVNLGNPGEFTMKELAGKVLALTGSSSKIVWRPLPQDDPKMRRPDISLAKARLGWEPRVVLDDGLSRTIPYFKDALAHPD
jgi:UDP-glucuronate decarboxylase